MSREEFFNQSFVAHPTSLPGEHERRINQDSAVMTCGLGEVVHELAQIVMKTAFFDFSKLGAADVRDLLNDGKDLRRFKDKLATFAARIPKIKNPQEREQYLEQVAVEVLRDWEKYVGSLPKVTARYLLDNTEQGSKLAEGLKMGALAVFGKAAGMLLLLDKARVLWQAHHHSPFRLLNRVEASLANSASLYVPPWSKLARGSALNQI